ncbi:hypothetical protein CDAR_450451 [Caerostris darwini]|uniref:Uncharacterized protein n=1 Tax=Caerostris darwini TaxID=1538125 RepID=A0AAV4NHT4_9ARAC|nr:hypothetical protein CDAR_450451 [Caerostris darwini]
MANVLRCFPKVSPLLHSYKLFALEKSTCKIKLWTTDLSVATKSPRASENEAKWDFRHLAYCITVISSNELEQILHS